ncbi:DUF58 domain-containing protein [Solimonas sp. K1W22B-7]|uniref:DUF58 domain-containing protein n=1 Tax=Solimonas sp. K1W22B-7 TaxID=2303331 RepID=UPI000E33541F|nr:DUF58 domain-containing protein [Solimonas sp. K1W22B-7]AXQ29714.1 DUF58 domain-containing protein [Solimonas sp. K1W22B-7]
MRVWLVVKLLLHPLRFLQDRIDAWVMARVKRQPGPIPVPRTRVYIVPTRFGYGFAFMAALMLAGSMNYSNSMGFALTFLLGALGLVCMHQTHGNLLNVQLRAGKTQPVFAGEVAHFEILVDNPAPTQRYSFALAWPRKDDLAVTADIPAEGSATMRIALPAERRGWLPARVFSLSTEFPLGLFHAWTWAELDMACLVYPKPAAPGRMPPPSSGAMGQLPSNSAGQDEFAGLRSYHRGDSMKSVHWKSLPKSPNSPMVKQFTELLDQELWLDWDKLPDLDVESRLSQLTRWVLDTENQGHAYGLRLPGLVLAPSRGETHQNECLRALALYQAQ